MIESHKTTILPDSSYNISVVLTVGLWDLDVKICVIIIPEGPYNNIVDFWENPACIKIRSMTAESRRSCILIVHRFHAISQIQGHEITQRSCYSNRTFFSYIKCKYTLITNVMIVLECVRSRTSSTI